MTHTQVKPHKCDVCGKGFRNMYSVRVHKEKFHPEETEKKNEEMEMEEVEKIKEEVEKVEEFC